MVLVEAAFEPRGHLAVVDDRRECRVKLDVEPSRGLCGIVLLFRALLDQARVGLDGSFEPPAAILLMVRLLVACRKGR